MKNYICYIGLLFGLLCPLPSFAEMTLFVSPNGDGAFIIEADNINDTNYVEITVSYDQAILTNPRVHLQGGVVTNIFDSIPGTLTFNAFRGDSLSSPFEAHLDFDKKSNSEGGIISVKAISTEPDGTNSPSRSMLNLPSPPSSTTQTTEPGREHVAASASEDRCEVSHEMGSCKVQIDSTKNMGASTDTVSNDGKTEPRSNQSAATEDTVIVDNMADMQMQAEKSVLMRFKEFSGEKSLKAFTALFERSPRSKFIQEPSVVISDGKTPVRIRLELQSKGEGAPNIALSDAKLVQLRKESEKLWVVTVLPKKGTWNASLAITRDSEFVEITLVVAPAVKLRKIITERNFVTELDRYIFEQVAGGKEEHNPLPRITNEYVFTANYLAGVENSAPQTTSEQTKFVSSTNE